MQRRYVAVRGASLAGGVFQSWLGDILEGRLLLGRVLGREKRRGSCVRCQRGGARPLEIF